MPIIASCTGSISIVMFGAYKFSWVEIQKTKSNIFISQQFPETDILDAIVKPLVLFFSLFGTRIFQFSSLHNELYSSLIAVQPERQIHEHKH